MQVIWNGLFNFVYFTITFTGWTYCSNSHYSYTVVFITYFICYKSYIVKVNGYQFWHLDERRCSDRQHHEVVKLVDQCFSIAEKHFTQRDRSLFIQLLLLWLFKYYYFHNMSITVCDTYFSISIVGNETMASCSHNGQPK